MMTRVQQVRCWTISIRERLKDDKVEVIKEIIREYGESRFNISVIASALLCRVWNTADTWTPLAAKMRAVALYVHKFKTNVIKCQRIIRAFNAAVHHRQKEMGHQWDTVANDLIGNDAGKQWMHRLLNQAKIDENGKAFTSNDPDNKQTTFKEAKILIEIRKMRKAYLAKLDDYKDTVRVFKAKVEMLGQITAMGLDPVRNCLFCRMLSMARI